MLRSNNTDICIKDTVYEDAINTDRHIKDTVYEGTINIRPTRVQYGMDTDIK